MADRYRVIRDGTAEPDVILWDGKTPYAPPGGGTLVKAADWQGPVRAEAPDPRDTNRRTIDETLAQLVTALGQDRDRLVSGNATAAQKDAALLRCVRVCRSLVRVRLDQLDAAD